MRIYSAIKCHSPWQFYIVVNLHGEYCTVQYMKICTSHPQYHQVCIIPTLHTGPQLQPMTNSSPLLQDKNSVSLSPLAVLVVPVSKWLITAVQPKTLWKGFFTLLHTSLAVVLYLLLSLLIGAHDLVGADLPMLQLKEQFHIHPW